ncbi:uncharacterized protein BO72DRAFT_498889 [Aspergillus fijiensis CBS 313.89]|uniref:EF-hand domain-containing protein n=1 Tax=Aspergillus fijiensis CBS 313.89 TaxID=1448319 RepID=A0A8G1VWY1_9EURO|nr:uncharacterized protein BO72DRAFT_498889 [Aspergillus fijiensis CBS 313.89]RAK74671.1 hypothetical protein BO72DRAFT_498889 [Aspergillus fijiensis CBS 313.89]
MAPASLQMYQDAQSQIRQLQAELQAQRINSENEKRAEKPLRPFYKEVLEKKNPDEWLQTFFETVNLLPDKDANGYVSPQEMIEATKGEKEEDLVVFFRYSDTNSDVRISFAEWVIVGFVCAEQETEYSRAEKN